MTASKTTDIEHYFSGFPFETRIMLEQLRETILNVAPEAEEMISYKMPAFKLKGMLVWYAAFKKHIGLYPTASPIKFFKDELTSYKYSKGAIQFPLNQPLPLDLISKIVKFKMKENLTK
jgi:uncharacterized protein YdhG (YjbR/CyaY superfamily)